MKSTKQKKGKGLASRTELVSTRQEEPVSKPATGSFQIDFVARRENRLLSSEKVLELIGSCLPEVFELAQVVRSWVWVRFSEAPAGEVRQQLAQIGFHWNRKRQTWQHPCGVFGFRRERRSSGAHNADNHAN